MSRLFVAAVLPCLNEAELLPSTCASLGFAEGQTPPNDTVLVLVDNGSNDGTQEFAESLRASLPQDTVLVAHEPERGYVPPRVRGNAVAAEAAARWGISPEMLLIAQADADTRYSPGYLEELRREAEAAGVGILVNACMTWPNEFQMRHCAYFDLCDRVDEEFAPWLMDHPADVMVSDNSCGYRYSDYLRWGGHRRERASGGDEIHAETTRLYIRGRASGARRRLCPAAVACHSPRRLVAESALSTATAGFPRESRFRAIWAEKYTGPNSLDAIAAAARADIAPVITARRAHLWGLFVLLPALIDQIHGHTVVNHDSETLAALTSLLRERADILSLNNSAAVLESVLEFIDAKLNYVS
jgi:glycosyltransferase involved in cell wall biosynthesis